MADELKAQQKLRWLGFKSAAASLSNIKEEVNLLKENLPDAGTFSDHLQNGYDYDGDSTKESIDTFTDFGKYLSEGSNSIGFTTEEKDKFIEKIKQNFTDEDNSGSVFDEFKNYVINNVINFEDLKGAFASTNTITGDTETTQGIAAAGIRFFESEGRTKDNVQAPAGSVEVYGKEVHFSQTEGTLSGSPSLTYKNISASDTNPDNGQEVTISVDIENSGNGDGTANSPFFEDSTRINSRKDRVSANSTISISFDVQKSESQQHEYSIGDSGTVTVTWTPAQLI